MPQMQLQNYGRIQQTSLKTVKVNKEKCEEVANQAKMAFAHTELSNAEMYITIGMLQNGLMQLRREKQ